MNKKPVAALHVAVTQELAERVHDRVQSGMYNSASEVVREALRLLFSQQERALESWRAERAAAGERA